MVNQWESVSTEVCAAVEAALQPIIEKARDDLYGRLLETTQDYLSENLTFNIASRINGAERQAKADRLEAIRLRSLTTDMLDALRQWANAEQMNDAKELENARTSRDLAIAEAEVDQ